MSKFYVLFEHAAGYAVFKVKEFEEISALLPQLESAVYDLAKFNSIVHLESFSPFKTAVVALENINAISEGIVHDDLKQFLDITLPAKRKKVKLGVTDPKLGAAITEVLGVPCDHVGAVPEIMRGIRFHFHHLVKGFTPESSCTAQLGLGHAYSRGKIKFNVHRVDNMIIQSIAILDQMDKNINTITMRLREWFSYTFPELVKIVPENYMFARLVKFIKNRSELTEESLEELENITMDSAKAKAIWEASKTSMGMDVMADDLIEIEMLADRVISSSNYRKQLSEYLGSRMGDVAPNLATLVGDQVGARLIAQAGSLTSLAKCPASTVQILGAEKALFRALKTKSNTPKYGLLFHSTFIGRAGTKNKGRISRYLANKCSIASRIDCFADKPDSIFGEKLKQQVEDRLKFYETGDIPKKNIEVMQEAINEQINLDKSQAEEKDQQNDKPNVNNCEESNSNHTDGSKKKKKKKHNDELTDITQNQEVIAETEITKKKNKKKRNKDVEDVNETESTIREESPEKKKSNDESMDSHNGEVEGESITEEKLKKKKKRKRDENVEENSVLEEPPKKKKKSKKTQGDI